MTLALRNKFSRSNAILLTTLMASVLLTSPLTASVAVAATDTGLIQQTQSSSTFNGAMLKLWSKLRTLSPKADAGYSSQSQVIATAGVRGSEATDSALQPYWKGDKTNDVDFRTEIENLNKAQELVDQGQLPQAVQALDKFIKDYPASEFRANALFAKALAQGGAGDRTAGVQTLKSMLKDYPEHPLKADAQEAINLLSQT
ncbi:MAG: tetratricopeptide repeat protein [Gammaproteobacteria bacterium]|nr:tetratricopeptide repeat protein [Gammaproteobacteria bacterium]